jgi:excisionase family DNA binding protein
MKSTVEVTATLHGESLLTKREVAKKLTICERSVDNLMRSKSLAFVRIGRAIRFEPAALVAFKNSYRVNAS